jgi:hypothetical protein
VVYIQSTLFSKMSQDSSIQGPIVISPSFSIPWPNAGQWTLHGGLSMPSTGSLSEDVGCLLSPASHPQLSDILEKDVPQKYYLSPKAARGILRRAEKRGRELPTQLREALSQVATDTTSTERST